MAKTDFPGSAVFTPPEVSAYAKEWIEELEKSKARSVKFGISALDSYFAPMLPGQLCAVIAQTSHYKSGFMHSWERQLANQLMRDGRTDECVVHVSVEESVEEQGILMLAIESGEDSQRLARGDIMDWTKLKKAAVTIGVIPIFRIGDALSRPEDLPNLYMSNMIRAIHYLESKDPKPENRLFRDRSLKIAAIFFDYLQAFPFDPEHRIPGNDQRRLQVRDDIYRLRQASHAFKCPVIVAVQAKQKLDGAPSAAWQMPGVYDGEESSSIAQRADRVITLWMPKNHHPAGTVVELGSASFTVRENTLWIKICKQRGGLPSGRSFQCLINFQDNIIAPEIKAI